jgi:hypothetical protein
VEARRHNPDVIAVPPAGPGSLKIIVLHLSELDIDDCGYMTQLSVSRDKREVKDGPSEDGAASARQEKLERLQ